MSSVFQQLFMQPTIRQVGFPGSSQAQLASCLHFGFYQLDGLLMVLN
jgi:hypothetical protein